MRSKRLSLIFVSILLVLSCLFPALAMAEFDRDAIKKSVFKLYVDYVVRVDGIGTGIIRIQGTTFAIGKKGEKVKYLVTNYHIMDQNEVINDAVNDILNAYKEHGISASPENIAKSVHVQEMHPYIILYDAPIEIKLHKPMLANDLAVIAIVNDNERLNVAPLVFGDPDSVKTGDKVYAYGYPGIVDQLVSFYEGSRRVTAKPEDVSVTNGEVNQKTIVSRQGSDPLNVIISTAPSTHGNSGGPLVNDNGTVIGIITYGSSNNNNYTVSMVPNNLISVLDTVGIPYEKAAVTPPGPVTPEVQTPNSSSVAALLAKPAVIIAAVVLVVLIGLSFVFISKKRGPVPPTPDNPSIKDDTIQASPVLVGVSGHFAGNNMDLTGTMIIGRDPAQCQLVFPANTTDVSRRHCCISFNTATQSFVLEDLNSSNGTYLANGQRVLPGHLQYLKDGDKFYLGVPGNMFEVKV